MRPNEWMNSFLLLCDVFFFIFWKKLKTPKRHFKINWPLFAFSHYFLHFWLINIDWFSLYFFRLGIHNGLTGFAGIFLAALVAQSLSLISTGYTNFFTRVWNAWNMVSIWFSKTLISHDWFNSIVLDISYHLEIWVTERKEKWRSKTGCQTSKSRVVLMISWYSVAKFPKFSWTPRLIRFQLVWSSV